MPVPHLNIRIVQRSKGSSAVAGAAYQAGEKLFSEYDQKSKDHRRKQPEVVYTEILLPANAPPEYADRATLWNAAEEAEKQWNAQLARRFVLALPREVPLENVRRCSGNTARNISYPKECAATLRYTTPTHRDTIRTVISC